MNLITRFSKAWEAFNVKEELTEEDQELTEEELDKRANELLWKMFLR